jgi:hypothetical protein
MPLIFRLARGAAAESVNTATGRRAAHTLVAGHTGDKDEHDDKEKNCFSVHSIISSYSLLGY